MGGLKLLLKLNIEIEFCLEPAQNDSRTLPKRLPKPQIVELFDFFGIETGQFFR